MIQVIPNEACFDTGIGRWPLFGMLVFWFWGFLDRFKVRPLGLNIVMLISVNMLGYKKILC
jgi:hypothetical protein